MITTLSVDAHCGATPKTVVRAKGFTLLIDEPPLFGGNDEGPSPVDTLLAAIAGCVAAIGQWVAKEKGISIRTMDIRVDGDIDAAKFFGHTNVGRAGFERILIKIAVETEADDEVLQDWLEQVLSRCPVIDNMTQPTDVQAALSRV